MRLTGPNVARLSLPAGKSDHIVFDDALPGFGVRLRAGGKRVWIAQYRVGTKQRRLTIGSVEKVTADAARAHAKAMLANVQLGGDPQIEKSENRNKAVITLGAVANRYLEGRAKARLKARSFQEVERHFRLHWKPLRERPLHKLQRSDIASRLNEIGKENGPFAANRARASLSGLFTWAMREGLADANPVAGTNRATDEVSRDRVLSDDELAMIWNTCRDDDYGQIVRLLMLTGQRREEVGAMRASELDLDRALWSLPRERTKNGLPHDVPLSAPAVTLLAAVPRRDDRELLFGRGEGAFSGWSKGKAALDARIAEAVKKHAEEEGRKPKPTSPWRLHDIRRTVATRMADLGVLPHVIEAVLNHVSGHRAGVAGIYNRALYAKEKREALNLWAAHVASLSEPSS